MKEFVINNSMNIIKKYTPNYDSIKLEEIRYGLISIYLLISKLIIIFFIAYILKIIPIFLTFIIIYNIIRLPSFGMHASKSWICLLCSTIIFIGVPILANRIIIPIYVKVCIGIITILLMYKNSPADTHKKPIISKKRRLIYKYLSVIFTITYSFLAITLNNNFLQNSVLFASIIQCIIISPYVYKLFKMPYNNYLKYIN